MVLYILSKFGSLWPTNGMHGAWRAGRPSHCNSPTMLCLAVFVVFVVVVFVIIITITAIIIIIILPG